METVNQKNPLIEAKKPQRTYKPYLIPLIFLLIFILIVLLTIILTTTSKTRKKVFSYISVTSSLQIYDYDLESSSFTKKFEFSTEGSSGPMAFSPSKQALFAATSNTISSYKINLKNGNLTLISNLKNLVDYPVYLSTDKSGFYLFVAYYSAGVVEVYQIFNQSHVAPTPIQQLNNTCVKPHFISSIEIQGIEFVYVPCLGSDEILQFIFNPKTGFLTPNSPRSVLERQNAGPRHMAFSENGKYAYIINELDSTVSLLSVRSNGTLEIIQTLSTLPRGAIGPNAAADIHLHPSGKYLYGSNRGNDSVVGFRVNVNDGELSLIGFYSFFNSTFWPRVFSIDPNGKFLVAVGQHSGAIEQFQIHSDGSLTRFGRPFYVGLDPLWIFFLMV